MKLKEDYMDGDFSYRDRRRMEQGKAPEWATKMEEIGPRKKKLRQSSSYSEIAMRSVNSPDGKVKKDHLESDWRAEKEGQKKMNRTIAAELKKMLGTGYRIETEDFADYFSIYKDVGNEVDEYRIYSRSGRYFVKFIGHKSIFDVKTKMCNSLKEIVEFMKLDEAVKVLKKNGYKLVEAYDAVTDHKNIKDRKQGVKNYFHNLEKRLKLALAEEGIETKITNNGYGMIVGGKHSLTIAKAHRDLEELEDQMAGGKENYEDTIGSESDEFAVIKDNETDVTLRLFDKNIDCIAKKEFDVRNTPGMVNWILANID